MKTKTTKKQLRSKVDQLEKFLVGICRFIEKEKLFEKSMDDAEVIDEEAYDTLFELNDWWRKHKQINLRTEALAKLTKEEIDSLGIRKR